jgi:eukaryotic-like serine/threonine-protein kinase
LAKNLRALPQRQAAQKEQAARQATRVNVAQRWRVLRLAGVGAVILSLGVMVLLISHRSAKVRRAHEQVPEITRLAAEENYAAAFALAEQAEQYIPTDPALTNLWPHIAVSVSIATTPAGADVYLKEYKIPGANWRYLGKSPLNTLRIPRGFYRWQIKRDGHEIVERTKTSHNESMAFTLDLAGAIPAGMVRMSGRRSTPKLWGVEEPEPVELEDFLIDKFEVSNKQFKEFVDGGGYERTNYWKLPFIKDGKSISREQAMTEFQDKTGRPGPATWVNGTFPSGQGAYPVSGVSWYEAAAYAEFAGKSLPTLYHWYIAAGGSEVAEIIPFSNFGGQGLAPAGRHHGMSPSGAFDMAGNVAEWIWNEGESGQRWIAGGAWNDPTYMFATPVATAPLNRALSHGFRCMKILSAAGPPQATVGPLIPVYRDYKTEKPVSDDVFRGFRGFYLLCV